MRANHVGFVELCIAWSRVLVLKFYVLFSRNTATIGLCKNLNMAILKYNIIVVSILEQKWKNRRITDRV